MKPYAFEAHFEIKKYTIYLVSLFCLTFACFDVFHLYGTLQLST